MSHRSSSTVVDRRPVRVSTLLIRLVGLAAVTTLAVLALPGATTSAAAQAGESITIRHSGKCLGIEGGSTGSGAAVQQQTCTGAASQSWTTVDAGGGYVQLRVAHSGLCLNVFGGATANLTRLVQWPCGPGANEQFLLQPTDQGWATIVARHSSKCVDIEAASSADGARAIQYTCHGGNHQQYGFDAVTGDPATDGRWGSVIDTPLVPVAASGLPNGKVLMWSAYERFSFGGDRGYTQTMLFDPATSGYTERRVSNTGHDMFCPGISNLADGRVLVNGGSSSAETSIYNPATDAWEDGSDMNIPRGYQGTTLLSDGSAFTLGGSWSGGRGNKTAEVWTAGSGWQTKPGIPADPFTDVDPQGIYRSDNHMWLFGWKDETVFHAGPSREMHWIDTAGSGSYRSAGNRGSDPYAMNGNAIMYEPGRILAVGGAPAYNNGQATTNATVIDITGNSVATRTVGSMSNARGFHSSTVLPSGEVVVTGGQNVTVPFSDDRSVLATEIWDPNSETFRTVAPMSVPRNYHSLGLLLADGRVLVGGGGLCGGCATNHADVQIYSPPYLFNADGSDAVRPRIISAPESVDLNEVFEVTTNTAVTEFTLVRMSSATHAVNNDQRRIPLSFTPGDGNLAYDLRTPADGGVAIPGAYMLFATDGSGVPSVAAVLTVTTDQAPVDQQPPAVSFDFVDGATLAIGQSISGRSTDSESAIASADFVVKNDAGQWVDPAGNPEQNRTPRPATISGQAGNGAAWTLPVDLPPGSYDLEVRSADELGNTSGWAARRFTIDPAQGSEIGGLVADGDGGPVAGVKVDLFLATADGSRGSFLGSTTTDGQGRYRFAVDGGCYVLTMIAPQGATFSGSRWYQPDGCVDGGQQIDDLDGLLTSDQAAATLGGVIAASDGSPVPGAKVDLFEATADGSRGRFVGFDLASADGSYGFAAPPGCYVLTFIAPQGQTYNGSRWYQPGVCLQADQAITDFDATLDPPLG